MPKDDWFFWLTATNIALGVVVVLAVLVVAYALGCEIVSRYKKSRDVANLDAELSAMLGDGRLVPGLGVTMADGGEPIKPLPAAPTQKKSSQE
ncbi:MAG: hypothetical protein ACLQVG_32485 [Terriglobia bacterium]